MEHQDQETADYGLARPAEVRYLLEQVCRHIVARLGATSCALSSWDRDRDRVFTWITYAQDPGLEPPTHLEAGGSYALADYPTTRRVLEERVAVNIRRDDPQADPSERAFIEQAGQQSLLMLPLVADQQVVGLLEIYQRDRPRSFTPEEMTLAQALADQAAIVIESGHLFAAARQEAVALSTLLEASSAIVSSLDLDTVLRRVAEQMTRLLHVEECIFSRWDQERETVSTWVKCLRGQTEVWTADRPGDVNSLQSLPLTARVLQQQVPAVVQVDDPQADPAERAILEEVGMRSLLMLPVVAYEHVVGLVELREGRRRREFDPHEIAMAQSLANQAAIAIENARLFREREQRLTEMSILNAIGQAISASLDRERLLETVHQQIGRIFDTTNFFIALYEEGSDEWVMGYQVEHGVRQPAGERHRLGAGLTGYILRTRQPLLLHSAAESEAWHQEHGIPLLGEQSKSWMGVPMIAADKVLGVLAIQSYEQEHLYDLQDVAIFSTIATQVANALANLRLLEETRLRAQEMEALNEVGRAITSLLDLDTLLNQIVDITKARFGYYFVGLVLLEGERLVFRAGSTIGDSDRRLAPEQMKLSLREGPGLIAEAARTGQPVIVNDVLSDPRYLAVPELADTRAELDVPIIFQDSVIGVLDVQSDRPHAYSAREVALLQAMVNQAAAAIQNARLYAQVQQQVEELRRANETQTALWQQVQEMSTPVIPVHDRVLVLPLVGTVDSERARLLTDRLLEAVRRTRALVVLLDITGVPVVDTAVAQALIQSAGAARLLGAEVVLVGVRSEVAQTLVTLGVSMEGLVTKSNLQAGIAHALGRVGLRIVPEELLPKPAAKGGPHAAPAPPASGRK